MRIYEISIRVKEHPGNPANKVLGQFFGTVFRRDDRDEVVNKRNILDAVLNFGEPNHQKIIGQPP
jgi:hypothetical protein